MLTVIDLRLFRLAAELNFSYWPNKSLQLTRQQSVLRRKQMDPELLNPADGTFTVSDDGAHFDENALKGLAGEASPNKAYCCRLFRDDGRPARFIDIEANSRAEANLKCIQEARREGVRIGQVSVGACRD